MIKNLEVWGNREKKGGPKLRQHFNIFINKLKLRKCYLLIKEGKCLVQEENKTLTIFEYRKSNVKQNKNKKTGNLYYFETNRTLSRRKSAVDIKEKQKLQEKGRKENKTDKMR
jgi:hypothetical protein